MHFPSKRLEAYSGAFLTMFNWKGKKVISVAGGKGGVGKSCFSANMGMRLSDSGSKVLLVDADLGTANIHTLLGIKYPEKTLRDFTSGKVKSLNEALITTEHRDLKILSSAGDILSISAPNYKEKQKLINGLSRLDVEYIIFDIAAGANQRAIDFFTLAPAGIVIIQPVPTSLENAFAFIKNLLIRHLLRIFYHNKEMNKYLKDAILQQQQDKPLEFPQLINVLQDKDPGAIALFKRNVYKDGTQLFMVMNSIKNRNQIQVGNRFAEIIKKHLFIDSKIIGNLPYDPYMDQAISERTPFILKYPDSEYTFEILRTSNKIKEIFRQ